MMCRRSIRAFVVVVAAATLIGAGCSRRGEGSGGRDGRAQERAAAPAPTNRVAIPAPVRQNLGITFATVERRAVAETVRAPGRFELLPDARREYRTMVAGQVEPAVRQFDAVEPGTVLYRLNSPRWREMQREIAAAETAIRTARAASETIGPLREAHAVHESSLEESVTLWTGRVEQLERVREAGGGKADELAQARATLTSARAELADIMEKDAELEARQRQIDAELESAQAQMDLLLASAADLTRIPAAELAAGTNEGGPARWRTIDVIAVRATAPGIVESVSLSGGSWADATSLVLSTIEPRRLRFHARGLQGDLGRFRDGLAVRIAPPGGGSIALQDAMEGTLAVGLRADPDDRTIELFVTPAEVRRWARPGVSAFMEVTLAGGQEELAVPLSAVTRDGVMPVLFRRDPKDPDTAIRIDADLGIDDGRWVVVKSGLRAGDEVVLDGAFQLMLATSGTAAKGGHFHSDGTFHEGEDH